MGHTTSRKRASSRKSQTLAGRPQLIVDWECPHCSQWFSRQKNGPSNHLRFCKVLHSRLSKNFRHRKPTESLVKLDQSVTSSSEDDDSDAAADPDSDSSSSNSDSSKSESTLESGDSNSDLPIPPTRRRVRHIREASSEESPCKLQCFIPSTYMY